MLVFDTDMKLRLREARENKYLSQAELAKESGVSRATIARIEGGTLKTDPHWVTIRRLAAGLGVEPSDLIIKED